LVSPSGAVRRAGRRRLLAYCIATLIPVLAIGLLIGWIADNELQRQGLAGARAEGTQIDQTFVALVGPNQRVNLSPAQVTALTGELRQMTSERKFYGIRVWSSAGALLVDTGGPFAPRPLPPAALRSVARGAVLTTVLNVPGSADHAVGVSETTIPGSPASGYLTVYLPYNEVQAELAAELNRIDLGLIVGLALLYVVLFLINQSTTRRLRREADRNAWLARTDLLTGLPNRLALQERLERMLRPPQGQPLGFAVIVMDLNKFKHVNDNLGHAIGDGLLREVGERLRACTRGGDFVARLGGDEFAFVLSGISDREQVGELIERVRGTLRTDIVRDTILLSMEGSFGVATSPRDGEVADVLLQRADTAMYRAKATGTSVQFYDEVADMRRPEWLTLAGQLRHAVAAGELRLLYQPKVALDTGALIGVEALLRWQHPERGLIGPDEFLGVAEETGAIREITEWVIDQALAQMVAWDQSTPVPAVAVNVSTKSLRYEDGLPDTVAAALRWYGIAADRLIAEVTETALIADNAAARDVLLDLSQMGVRISIDDFGKGFAGIGYLTDMPVNELKLDREFVSRMLDDRADYAIVQSVVDLARRLGLDCTAEGIESRELLQALRTVGCGRGQGFFISVPLGPEELGLWVRSTLGGVHPARPFVAPAPRGLLLGR
jgi:diguanylate cyclase (GGDEF)-like protein